MWQESTQNIKYILAGICVLEISHYYCCYCYYFVVAVDLSNMEHICRILLHILHLKNIFFLACKWSFKFSFAEIACIFRSQSCSMTVVFANCQYCFPLCIFKSLKNAVHLYLCLVHITLGWILSTSSRVDYQNRFVMCILAVFFTTRQVHSSYCHRRYVKQKEIIVIEGKVELVGAEENNRKQWMILISVVRSYYDS